MISILYTDITIFSSIKLHNRNENCTLDENKICNDCGECDKCDLEQGKLCDNCGKCIGLDADSRAIEIEDVILKN